MPSPISVSLNGQLVTWTIPARNNGAMNELHAIATISIAGGASQYVSHVAPTGTTFNFVTGIWNIGALAVGVTKHLTIVTRVTNITDVPMILTSVLGGDNIDSNLDNNTYTDSITVADCPPTAGAIDDPNSCICGSVAGNDTPCTHGVTTYVLDEESISNGVLLNWDDETGTYNFAYINPFLPITFEYSIWCDPGTGALETSGPAEVTIHPIFGDDEIFSFSVTGDPENLNLLVGANIIASIPVCEIVDTCSELDEDDLG